MSVTLFLQTANVVLVFSKRLLINKNVMLVVS